MLLDRSRQYYEALRGPNGRFRFLNISEVILPSSTKSVWFDTPVSIDFSGKSFSGVQGAVLQKSPLADAIPALWKSKVKHTVIVGDGGMGKTVTLIHLWEKLLQEDRFASSSLTEAEAPLPIPVFIALNQFNQVPESRRDGFILETIRKDYQLDEISILQIESLMRAPLKDGEEFIPSVVLLLDGFNEITVEKSPLLIELNRLTEQYPRIQVVMTSRSDMRGNFNWSHWNLVNLQLLDEEKVTQYLNQRNMPMPQSPPLFTLLGNPMMLTLYVASCEIQKKLSGSEYCCFMEKVETPGELLWNFIQAQVGNLPEKLGHDQRLIHKYKFLLFYFLPALGFEMEKARLFDFKREQMDACIDLICKHFSQPHFLDAFTQFDEYIDALPLGECANPIERRKRNGELKKILTHELHMLVDDGQSFRFLHQNFRDFFAALHILNEMEVAIKNKQIPDSLKERVLDCFVRKYIGEIEGEHSAKPYIDEEKKVWRIDINKENRLHRILELCRYKFGEAVGYATWNIIEIWKDVRGELTGADLTRLDLTTVQLNAVRCSRSYNETYLAAVFDRSRLHEKSVLPQGHSLGVNSAVYSPDGKKILSASMDNTIKEWDAATGQCVKTLAGHTDSVTSALYSVDGKKILSASNDQTIKEWDSATGQCVKTLTGHTDSVISAVYSPDGIKILSVSNDNTIKEWDAATGQCVQTLAGHTHRVYCAVYSPDEKKILSATWDHTIKEWDAASGACVKTLIGHTSVVTSAEYSADGKKILSASWDETIKEWDVTTGVCVKTLVGHTNPVNSSVYSPDGEKILSASLDTTIKEWDVATGACVKTLAEHTGVIESAWYSLDGKKILSASWDETIKEWDAAIGACVKTLVGHTHWVNSAVYSPDGKKILSASLDNTIKEWDTQTSECIKTLVGHSDEVNIALYDLNGFRILSESQDGTIKEWDAATGQCLQTYDEDDPNISRHLYMNMNKKIKTSGNKIFVWDSSSKEQLIITNIPGLFIQRCSFKNLEKSSQWTEEGLKILKQYGAILD